MGFLKTLFNISNKSIKNQTSSSVEPKTNYFSNKDMEQFSLPYQFPIFSSDKCTEFPLNTNNQFQALTDIKNINNFLKCAQNLAHIETPLEICTESINFININESQAKLILTPYTPTGKKSKYPLLLRFYTENFFIFNNADDSYKGELFYMQDGTIGKAHIICRTNKIYTINLGLIGTSLSIKSIESTTANGEKIFLYKSN